jgi:RNA polymerase sigma factor (sigma-70 family)
MANLDRSVLFKKIDQLYREGTFTALGDAQLLERYLFGRDERAFESLVNLHGPMVLALCRRFLRDPHDIEDAFQATFFILARKASSIRNREVIASWLYGVAYKVAVRARTRLLKQRSFEAAHPLIDDQADGPPAEFDDIGPVLDHELNRLPEKLRAPLVLCYLKEQTHDQAAAELRWPVGTVRSRLARGRELLRERLTRRGCAPTATLLVMTPRLSFRSMTFSVPEELVQSTVAAASRFLAGSTGGIGRTLFLTTTSGSAPTLAQGVLTTMAFAQFKMIGAGVAAIGVLAGGLSAGAWSLGSSGQGQQGNKPMPDSAGTVARQVTAPPVTPPPPAGQGISVEARLANLERKLDLLLGRWQRSVGAQQAPMVPGAGVPTIMPPATLASDPAQGVQAVPYSSYNGTQESTALVPDTPPRSNVPPTIALPANQPLRAPGPAQSSLPSLPPTPPTLPSLDQQTALAPAQSLPAQRALPPVPELINTDAIPATPATAPINQDPNARQVLPPSPVQNLPVTTALPHIDPAVSSDINVALTGDIPVQPPLAGPRQRVLAPRVSSSERASLRELEAELSVSMHRYNRTKALVEQRIASKDSFEAAVDNVRLIIGRLRGYYDDLMEEFERLKIEVGRKEAEVKVAEGHRGATEAIVARNKRLNERKPGMVSPEDVTKGESEDAASSAEIAVKRAEVEEVLLRLKHLDNRREILRKDVARAVAAIPELAKDVE